MPSITTIHESLPYIDQDPTPSERSAAESLIASERLLVPDDPFHALLPPSPSTSTSTSKYLTPLLQAEFDRISSSKSTNPPNTPTSTKLHALDLTRYESLDPPTLTSLSLPESLTTLRTALSRAYATHTYLSGRRAHLALLDSYGKNAWLVGNFHLEGELKALERELGAVRREIDVVTLQRKGAQDEAGPEIRGLDETWRKGVGRVLETEAAAEGLRREVLEATRRRMEE
ncbi:Pre-mRNA-splicing factor SPF27 [Cercophora scortea]|uniref:Pre-mRNA-splicing factor SPF27 n=1 Tax=Cercophora scortea TaxID=314031 RepID=A0AAE0MDG3_9PEZI|nr:Pre-mRNA-splicing factor SPF27 [Cercophora scortea]